MGAWVGNHGPWMQEVVHPNCMGAMPGRECSEASWDLQLDVEAAVNHKQELIVALLDYYKFFDSFDPRFFHPFLVKMGVDRKMADLFLDLNTRAVRRIKLGNTYGPAFTPYNALGQGDAKVLMCAILYVTVQMNHVDAIAPQVQSTAVVDDRSLRGPRHQIKKAVDEIMIFDETAGHSTNPKKMALMATSKNGRKWCESLCYGLLKPKVLQRDVLVGDVVTTVASGNGDLASRRMDHAIRGCKNVLRSAATNALKAKGAGAIAIPRELAISTWTQPASNKLKQLRTGMISTVMGRFRQMRCAEVVTALLTDPARFDPWGAFIFASLMKCRRLLRKSERRATNFLTAAQDLLILERQPQAAAADAAAAATTQDPPQQRPPKLAVGPVSGICSAVCALEATAKIDVDNLRFIIQPAFGPAIDLLHGSKKAVQDALRKMIRYAIISDLAEHVNVSHDEETEDPAKPRRKDMVGITGNVDIRSRVCSASKGRQ